jgi:hypothetical protein
LTVKVEAVAVAPILSRTKLKPLSPQNFHQTQFQHKPNRESVRERLDRDVRERERERERELERDV